MEAEADTLRKFQKELNAGTVSLVTLALLDQATEAMYGYQIAKHLEREARESTLLKQGTLYPLLRGMEGSGLLESEVEPSTSGPPRRYYTITEDGRATLKLWKEAWGRTRDFVDAVLRNAAAGSTNGKPGRTGGEENHA